MLEPSDLRRELAKIKELAVSKDEKSKSKAQSQFRRLQSMVVDDISKTGDYRVRALLKTMNDFRL